MEQAIVLTKNLSKRYGRQQALDGIDLCVPTGSVYGLLGPNGAGKTTLLKLLTGLLRPSAGEIWIEGRPWERDVLNHVGALIESPAIYGNLTAAENLRVHTLYMGLPDSRIRETLDVVGLANTGKKLAARFSLGMKQRLGIAIALLGQPELLILDEPGNGLDPVGMQEMRALIGSFCQQGITVIVSSHILSEVQHMATQVGIIQAGKLLYQGAPGSDLEQLFMDTIQAHPVQLIREAQNV
jgi:ABC-2 type transport system ATP-binding protein